jgi:transcriptional regulator with XRE-family HTH domain
MTPAAVLDDLSTVSAIGARVAARREELGLTQVELASRVGVSREWVLRFERGNSGANLGGVLKVLRELNITLNEQALSSQSPDPAQAPRTQRPRPTKVSHINAAAAAPEPLPRGPFYVVPDSLDRLHGPASGEVLLPKRLLWNPSRPFNLNDEKRARSMLRIVLREARQPEDLETYVNRDQLTRLWGKLSLPDYIRNAWEQRFSELARA